MLFCYFFLAFHPLSAMKQIFNVCIFSSEHECLCIREGEEKILKLNFFRNFLSKYKVDIFIGDEEKRRCFNAQLKNFDFYFPGKQLRRHNSFSFLHTETLRIHDIYGRTTTSREELKIQFICVAGIFFFQH